MNKLEKDPSINHSLYDGYCPKHDPVTMVTLNTMPTCTNTFIEAGEIKGDSK